MTMECFLIWVFYSLDSYFVLVQIILGGGGEFMYRSFLYICNLYLEKKISEIKLLKFNHILRLYACCQIVLQMVALVCVVYQQCVSLYISPHSRSTGHPLLVFI